MPYSEFPEGVKVEFYDQDRHKNTVQAKYGIIYPSADIVELRDSVVLTTYDGKKLNTAQLFWDQKKTGFLPTESSPLPTPKKVLLPKE